MDKVYTIYDVIRAECTLEPLECIFCKSHRVTFHQYVEDAYCYECGKWQLEESTKTLRTPKEMEERIHGKHNDR